MGTMDALLIGVLRPIFDTTYKGENRSKNTCELYIINWSYSYKVGIFLLCKDQRGHLGMDHVLGYYRDWGDAQFLECDD